MNTPPMAAASIAPSVDFPQPDTPITAILCLVSTDAIPILTGKRREPAAAVRMACSHAIERPRYETGVNFS
ncbi:hypothetical protein [Burkholderia sp. Bp9012]|uniref:hypothetical protein n=1 Tax=Burkholderia sp. Bp9012 TaxID=2184562 RepID=UPI001624DCE3|nr:hypothetical protein [Burkholderia sp. Bp9012]